MQGSDIAAVLRARNLRVTPQRRAILEAFRRARDEHLSAEEVTARASRVVPNIGRGTVYATLAELAELGMLSSVGSSEPVRYETNVVPHDHFRCRLCLRLFDVDLGGHEMARRSLEGFTVETVVVQAEGVCAQCHEYERGLHDGAARCLSTETLPPAGFDSLACVRTESPLGELALVASDEGIVHLAFSDHADFGGLAQRARGRCGTAAGRRHLRALADALEGYFAGSREPFEEVIDWRLLGAEQRAALICIEQIGFADHLSYDRLSTTLTAYERGQLMGCNPLPVIIPCHRVSRGSERPDAYVGGLDRLQVLRALEAR